MLDASGKARRACGSLVDLRALREGEAERRQAVEGLAGQFEMEVLAVVDQVAAAVSELEHSALGMNETADQTTRRSSMVSSVSHEASGNVQSVAAATEEVTASIREIGQQLARSTQATSTATSQARNAMEVVQSLVGAVRKIGDVVGLISTIAGQTNLPALNATIEAARTGDSSKGFAVVASEVKALAGQTAKATGEITSRIGAMQEATACVAKAIEEVSATIELLNGAAAAIAAAVEEQGATTAEIARNIQEAAVRTQHVSSTVEQVNASASETGEVSGCIAQSARRLVTQAGNLRAQVNRAQVNGFMGRIRAA